MSEFIRPPYLEPIQPTQRVPDYWPPPLTQQNTPAAAPAEAPIPQGEDDPSLARAEAGPVKLIGNLGTTPRFETLASGNLRVRFALSEHHEDGRTTWHRVYAVDK